MKKFITILIVSALAFFQIFSQDGTMLGMDFAQNLNDPGLVLPNTTDSLDKIDLNKGDAIPKTGIGLEDSSKGQPKGVVKEITLQDIADYSGNTLNVSTTAWEKFVKDMPQQLKVAKDAVNAIVIHQKLSNGDMAGAADSFLQYIGGVVLSDAEAAGLGPWATVLTLFQAYCVANDFIRDRVFIPELFNELYVKYSKLRDSGNSHEAAWDENLSAGSGLHPLLYEIKAKVIYPKYDVKKSPSGIVKAAREVKGAAAGRKVAIVLRDTEDWKYGLNRMLIRHKGNAVGGPRFRRIIDVEICGMNDDNLGKYTDEIMDGVIKLNEFNYREDPAYMNSTQLEELRKEVGALLKKILEQKPGENLDGEALEYLGNLLKMQYSKARLSDECSKKAKAGREELVEIAKTLIQIDEDLKNSKEPATGILPKASAFLPDPKLLPLPEGYQQWFMQKGRTWDQVTELEFGPAKIMQAQAEYTCKYDSNLVQSEKVPKRVVKTVRLRVTVTTTDNPQNMLKHYRKMVEDKNYSVMPWNDQGEKLGIGSDGRIRNKCWAWMKTKNGVYYDIESTDQGLFIREFCGAALKGK